MDLNKGSKILEGKKLESVASKTIRIFKLRHKTLILLSTKIVRDMVKQKLQTSVGYNALRKLKAKVLKFGQMTSYITDYRVASHFLVQIQNMIDFCTMSSNITRYYFTRSDIKRRLTLHL